MKNFIRVLAVLGVVMMIAGCCRLGPKGNNLQGMGGGQCNNPKCNCPKPCACGSNCKCGTKGNPNRINP